MRQPFQPGGTRSQKREVINRVSRRMSSSPLPTSHAPRLIQKKDSAINPGYAKSKETYRKMILKKQIFKDKYSPIPGRRLPKKFNVIPPYSG